MKRILAIGASSSRQSINRALARHAASFVEGADVQVLDLNDFEMPLYSIDREEEDGVPQPARDFLRMIRESDGVIISMAEHNGSYTAAFKNLLDWTSREEKNLWSDKPMLLMSTSPGGRGGATVMGSAQSLFPRLGARVVATFSLASYHDAYSDDAGIGDVDTSKKFREAIAAFQQSLS